MTGDEHATLLAAVDALTADVAQLSADLAPIIELFAGLQRGLSNGVPTGPLGAIRLLQGLQG